MSKRMVRLPNGSVVGVDEHGYMEKTVEVDLSNIIELDLEGVLDLLSERATGTEVLSDVTYEVVGHIGNTLRMRVGGDIELIDAEEVETDGLHEREVEATVQRVG